MLKYFDLPHEQMAEVEWDILHDEKLTHEQRYTLLIDVKEEYKCCECHQILQNCKCD